MRVRLKGVHTVRKRLADGSVATYYYAWRGGPRLEATPESPEFIASYERAYRDRIKPDGSLFKAVIADYLDSHEFKKKLRPRTQSDYLKQIAKIESAFGDLPIAALDNPPVTKVFRDWRDGLAETSLRQADYAWTVLLLLLDWAREAMGRTTYQMPERFRARLYHNDRAEKIWDDQQIAAFMAVAPLPLQRVLVFALETGQREGDLLTLPWFAFDPKPVPPTPELPKGAPYGMIRLVPSKSRRHDNPNGTRVAVPVSSLLRRMLDDTPPVGPLILTNAYGRPWQGNSFRKAWEHVAKSKAGIGRAIAKATGNENADRTFNDLRGTAITRLSVNGCPPQMIAMITGWSLRYVHTILDKYLARTDKLAVAAFPHMERTGA